MAAWNSSDGRYQEEEVLHGKWGQSGSGYGSRFTPPSSLGQRPRRSRKCVSLCIIAVLVVILVVCIAVGITVKVKDSRHSDDNNDDNSRALNSLSKVCQKTLYPDECYTSMENMTTSSSSPLDFVKYSLIVSANSVVKESTTVQNLLVNATNNMTQRNALNDCVMFLQDALDLLNDTQDAVASLNVDNLGDTLADLQTWMSAALTNQETCKDGLQDLGAQSTNGSRFQVIQTANETSELISNGLALVTNIKNILPKIFGRNGRRLLESKDGALDFLSKRLLQSANQATNIYVAQDGSGDYRRIMDAINKEVAQMQRNADDPPIIIHIKAGKYVEIVTIPKTINNLVFIGDGVGKTIISQKLSVIGSNMTTSMTATMTVQGKNFTGRDFTVENTAGPYNHQAVALRVTGDYALFQNCSFTGYQDTLYTHTNRQFYINCTVVGTVDFIFGNAAAVFQNSYVLASTGIPGQQNTYTASGRTDPNQNTGIIFQLSTFDGTYDFKKSNWTFPTYLGRPWKPYARTVIMESYEGKLVNSAGWLDWNGEVFTTVYFAEYKNIGPGFVASGRVRWSTQIQSPTEAQQFTVSNFIQGSSWIPLSQTMYKQTL